MVLKVTMDLIQLFQLLLHKVVEVVAKVQQQLLQVNQEVLVEVVQAHVVLMVQEIHLQ